jgi:hypothetical protein
MIINITEPIKFCGRQYAAAGQIRDGYGGHIVCDLVTPGGGSFFTTIPISSIEWRRTRPTYAAFRVESENSVLVIDDWGAGHRFEGPRWLSLRLFELCRALQIPEVA